MQPRNWRLRVEDILASIEKIESYTRGLDAATFSAHEMAVDAVIRNFLVIGEAARLMPVEIAERYPELPWSEMRDMRNLLVHEYFGISLATIWDTVQRDLPPLVPKLREILGESPLVRGTESRPERS